MYPLRRLGVCVPCIQIEVEFQTCALYASMISALGSLTSHTKIIVTIHLPNVFAVGDSHRAGPLFHEARYPKDQHVAVR